jgi:hypothetical protein
MTKLSELREKYLSRNALAAWEYHDLCVTYARKHLLPMAQNGHRPAALELIDICSAAIGDGVALDAAVGTWLSKILSDIAGGATVEKAANIPKRARGIKKERDAARRDEESRAGRIRSSGEHCQRAAASE